MQMDIAGTKASVQPGYMQQAMAYSIPEKINGSPDRQKGRSMRHQLPVAPNKAVPDRNQIDPEQLAYASKLPAPKLKDVSLNDGYVRLFGGQAEEQVMKKLVGPADV